MKKSAMCLATSLSLLLVASGCNSGSDTSAEDYPDRDITGVIPFGPGGASDSVARVISQHVEDDLGESIVLQNIEGGTGSIGTQEVYSSDADGYSLLFGAENANLYRTTGVSELSYNDFEPIILLGQNVPVIIVQNDAEWDSMEELLEDAEDNPGEINMATTGPVGISGVVTSMLDREFNMVPYDGEGDAISGVMGDQVDVSIASLSSGFDYIEAGEVEALGIVNDERLEEYEDLPALGEEMSEYDEYLPWGPYYGVYAPEGTPDEIISTLRDAFEDAYQNEEFQNYLVENQIIPLGHTGEEAIEFQNEWESVTNWLLYEAGEADDPSEYDIPEP